MAGTKEVGVVGDRSPTKTVVMLAWPVFVEQILVSMVGYIDTAMVGSMGKNATAAVNISNSPMFLINGLIMALGIGFTALISRSIGAGDIEKAKALMRQTLFSVLGAGVPLTLLCISIAHKVPVWMGGSSDILEDAITYNRIVSAGLFFRILSVLLTALYRGYGDTKTPMVINIFINIINVVGNFFLIFPAREISLFGAQMTMPGAGWGVAGAAVATTVSMAIGAVAMLAVTFLRRGPMQLSVRGDYRPDWGILKPVFRISLPAAFERVTMSLAGIVATRTIASLGTVALASHSLALTAESICYMPGFSMGVAATTLVGQALGAKKPELADRYVRTTVKIASAIMFVAGILLFAFAAPILSIFTPDADVIELGRICLIISATIQVPQVIAAVLSGALRGAGDTKWTFYIIAGAMWFLRVPAILLTVNVFHMGLTAVYIAMNTDICARCVGFYLRYRTGRWKTVLRD